MTFATTIVTKRCHHIPSIILGSWELGEPCRIRFDYAENDDEPVTSPATGIVEGQYDAELRLCIVPVGPDMRPEPALRVKIGLFCLSPELLPHTRSAPDIHVEGWIPTSKPSSIMTVATRTTQSVPCRIWSDGSALPEPIENYFPPKNDEWRGGCLFLPMTGIVAQDWFELNILADFKMSAMDMSLHIRCLGHHLLGFAFADDFSPFKSGTIAAGLDHCLSGKHGTNPLDLLDARADQFVRLFRNASNSARAERNAAMARLDSRLRKMRGEEPAG